MKRYGPNGRPIPDPNNPYPNNDVIVRSKLDHENAHTVLTINDVSLKTAGQYRCVVSNGDTVTELDEKLTLKVKAPPKVRRDSL